MLVAMLMVLCVPAFASGDGDSATADDVTITTEGGLSSIELNLQSDESKTLTIYVTNNSQDHLSLSVSDIDNPSFHSSSEISVIGTGGVMLFPAGDSGGKDIATIRVTITADRLTDTGTVSDALVINVTTIGAGTEGYFQETIPVTVHLKSVFTSEGSYNQFFGLFPNTLPSPFDNVWFTAFVTLVLWIIATIIVSELVIPVIARLFAKVSDQSNDKKSTKKISHALTKTITVLMLVVAVNECLNIVGANSEVMSLVSSVSAVLYVLFGGILCWQVYVFIITGLFRGIDEAIDVDGLDVTLIPLFKMLGKLIICVAAATIILAIYGVDLAGIMVSAGVITLGITFGAQTIISQFFSGLVILATRPFRKGDFVSINGTTYIVHKVRVMYTEFANWDNDQIVTMPNNTVSSATLVNFTKGNANTRIFIYVSIAYEADLSKAKELMIKAANMHPHVIKDGSVSGPGTRLINFGGSGIEYRLACFVDDYDNSSHYAGQIREIIYKLFKDNGIEIPYTKLEVTMKSECDGKRRADDTEPDI